MSKTLQPKSCGNQAFKKWVGDSWKLFKRGFWGFNVLWVVLFLFRGWVIQNDPTYFVSTVFFIAISALFFQFHRSSFIQLVNGHTDIKRMVYHWKYMIKEHKQMWTHNFFIRMGFGFLFIVFNILFYLWIQNINKSIADDVNYNTQQGYFDMLWNSTPWLQQWYKISLYSSQCSFMVLIFRKEGLMSMVIPLMNDYKVSLKEAVLLNKLAISKNTMSLLTISLASVIGLVLLSSFIPVIYPFLELIFLNISMCAYGDIFNGGYKIENKLKQPSVNVTKVAMATNN